MRKKRSRTFPEGVRSHSTDVKYFILFGLPSLKIAKIHINHVSVDFQLCRIRCSISTLFEIFLSETRKYPVFRNQNIFDNDVQIIFKHSNNSQDVRRPGCQRLTHRRCSFLRSIFLKLRLRHIFNIQSLNADVAVHFQIILKCPEYQVPGCQRLNLTHRYSFLRSIFLKLRLPPTYDVRVVDQCTQSSSLIIGIWVCLSLCLYSVPSHLLHPKATLSNQICFLILPLSVSRLAYDFSQLAFNI